MPQNSKLVKFPGPGCVVEFLHANQPLLAWVLEEQAGKLRLFTINKREQKLVSSRILPWPGPACNPAASRSEIEEELGLRQAARLELMRSINPEEIWELAQGEVAHASAEWFASLMFEQPGPDEVAAMGRVLLENKTLFRFQPPEFEVFEADAVERRRAEREAARIRELLVTEGHSFFKELWAWRGSPGKSRPSEPEAGVAEELRKLLMARIATPDGNGQPGPAADQKTDELWNGLRKGLPEHPYLPLLLAQAWGLVPPHYNFLLDRAGYDSGDAWSEAYADEIEAWSQASRDALGEPEPIPYLSIDSATTRDIDDAFHIVREPDGSFKVAIALACPARFFDFDSPLGKAVANRATSLYLPEGSSHMLPEAFGTDLFSLRQGEARHGLVLEFGVGPEGAVKSLTPRLATIRIAENLSYERAEAIIADGEGQWAEQLRMGLSVAKLLRAKRLERGAIIIERPEPKISLRSMSNGSGEVEVDLGLVPPTPESQLLVSEFMILANTGVAIWGGQKNVPLLYRTQEVSMPAGLSGVWERPEDIHRVVRHMGCTVLEPRPAPHASLAVPAYSPISSPLRRYSDLVNLAQLVGVLSKGEPLFSRAELEKRLPDISARLDAVSQVQRFRPRYWKLVYFKMRQKAEQWTGVVVEEAGSMVIVSLILAQIYVRAPRELFGDRVCPGQAFRIKLGKIDPLTNEIRIAEAWEE